MAAPGPVAARAAAGGAELPFVATKASRRADPFAPETFTEQNLRAWVERSRQNLAMDTLDLVQLHCPPPAIYRDDRVFDLLDTFTAEKKIAAWGVSVETCEEALISLQREHLASIQIILNPFRLKPLDEVLPTAAEKGVAIIARVPLASGLLTGKFSPSSEFAANDHRSFNRHGEAFDPGETFSGVDYETGLAAVARLEQALAGAMALPEASLRWILAQTGVTAAIPGASSALAALSVAGDALGQGFRFAGFLPARGGERSDALQALAQGHDSSVLFEAPHRIEAMLRDCVDVFGAGRQAAVCRELTKTYEEVRRGRLADLAEWAADGVRGEITVVIAGAPQARDLTADELVAMVEQEVAGGSSKKDAIALVASATGTAKRAVFEAYHAR